jgi:FixJ family two-component response regulator
VLDRIHNALEMGIERRAECDIRSDIEKKLARLTKREKEVMKLVVTGKPN